MDYKYVVCFDVAYIVSEIKMRKFGKILDIKGEKCDLASENRPFDIFNPNGVISIML